MAVVAMETVSQALLSPPLLSSSDIKRSSLHCAAGARLPASQAPCSPRNRASPGGDSIRSPRHAPTVDLAVLAHTRRWPFPSYTVTDDYLWEQFSSRAQSHPQAGPPRRSPTLDPRALRLEECSGLRVARESFTGAISFQPQGSPTKKATSVPIVPVVERS